MLHLQVLAQLPNLEALDPAFCKPGVRHLLRGSRSHTVCRVVCPAAPPSLQVLAQLPSLETADLSFNIYMEAAASLAPLTADGGLAALRRLDLRCALVAAVCAPCPVGWKSTAGLGRPMAGGAAGTRAGFDGTCMAVVLPVLPSCARQAAVLCALHTLHHGCQHLCVLRSHTCCRKMLGVWKDTSIPWLQGLVAALRQRHEERGGSPGSAPVVLWD